MRNALSSHSPSAVGRPKLGEKSLHPRLLKSSKVSSELGVRPAFASPAEASLQPPYLDAAARSGRTARCRPQCLPQLWKHAGQLDECDFKSGRFRDSLHWNSSQQNRAQRSQSLSSEERGGGGGYSPERCADVSLLVLFFGFGF